MSDDERKSPPETDKNGVVKLPDDGANLFTVMKDADISTDETPLHEISSLVPCFKFGKYATTDDIVNVDADKIDIDSFKYLNKDALVKALLYLIKDVDEVNKDLSSVSLPDKADHRCQCESSPNEISTKEISTDDITSPANLSSEQVLGLDTFLKNFQSNLLKSVDEKLLVVDQKISSALSFLPKFPQLNSGSGKDSLTSNLSESNVISLTQNVNTQPQPNFLQTEVPVQLIVDTPESITQTSNNTDVSNNVNRPSYANMTSQSTVPNVVNESHASMTPLVLQSHTQNHESLSTQATPTQASIASVVETSSQDQITASSCSSSTKSSEVLVLSPIDSGVKSLENMKKTKKLVELKLKDIQVVFVRVNNKSMKIIVGFKDSFIRGQGEKCILQSSDSLATYGYQIKCATKMLPKISLHNVLSEVLDDIDRSQDANTVRSQEKQVILDKILSKNPCIKLRKEAGHTLDVVYVINNNNNDFYTIGLKVSPAIRLAIIQNQQGNIYLGNSRYQFRDRFHVKHCYHCQMLGHISTDCPDKGKPPVCMFCMNHHRSSTCQLKEDTSQHCCVRCLASKHGSDAENCKTHNAGDSKCPVFSREMARLQENTDFASKNVL